MSPSYILFECRKNTAACCHYYDSDLLLCVRRYVFGYHWLTRDLYTTHKHKRSPDGRGSKRAGPRKNLKWDLMTTATTMCSLFGIWRVASARERGSTRKFLNNFIFYFCFQSSSSTNKAMMVSAQSSSSVAQDSKTKGRKTKTRHLKLMMRNAKRTKLRTIKGI